jgi:Arc/MetJ-type ribon-helix-helix transcriptional regulator
MTVQLQPAQEEALNRLVARGEYASAAEAVAAAVERLLAERPPALGAERRPIWEVIEEIRSRYPADAFDDLPEDGAEQHDHYIYGLPKRRE